MITHTRHFSSQDNSLKAERELPEKQNQLMTLNKTCLKRDTNTKKPSQQDTLLKTYKVPKGWKI